MTNSTTDSIDATLFGMPVRTGRWAFVLAGMLMNVYLGAVYAWSVFITPARKFRILAHTNPTRQRGL
jgi:hypothetical protein